MKDIYSVFSTALKNLDILATFTGESEMKLKKLSPIRWAMSYQSITKKLQYKAN